MWVATKSIDDYYEKDGISFMKSTKEECANVLNEAFKNKRRIRLFFGNKKTGEDWCERFDIMGYIGRSNGTHKVPLLLYRKNSSGGFAILTDSILKIVDTKTKKVLYLDEIYKVPKLDVIKNTEGYSLERTKEDGTKEILFNGTEEMCLREKDFLEGKTNKI